MIPDSLYALQGLAAQLAGVSHVLMLQTVDGSYTLFVLCDSARDAGECDWLRDLLTRAWGAQQPTCLFNVVASWALQSEIHGVLNGWRERLARYEAIVPDLAAAEKALKALGLPGAG